MFRTIIEVLVVVGCIYLLLHESAIADWEQKIINRLRRK